MANQKISQLTTITTVDTAADLFPIVDTSETTTKKITPSALKTALALNNVDNTSDANKPISTATQTALDGKVDENAAITGATKTKITYDAKGLVTAGADATTADIADSTNKRYVTDAQLTVIGNTSGTNTGDNAVNSLYSGLATSKQDTLVSGTNIKTVNSTSLLGSGDVAVQATLVSGTNIKTINSTSLLGSGDITISANPSGVSGAIQFSNGSAFASDAANLFWDDTNNRLGVGTNAPTEIGHFYNTALSDIYLKIQTTQSRTSGLISQNSTSNWFSGTQYSATNAYQVFDQTNNRLQLTMFNTGNSQFSISNTTMGAKLGIQGSGSTSATTSLLVQNSAGSTILNAKDDGNIRVDNGAIQFNNNSRWIGASQLYSGVQIYAVSGGSDIIQMTVGQQVHISSAGGITSNASAQLQIDSTVKGFLPPRMTTTQKNAIASPAAGLVVYDTTLAKLCVYTTTWETITSL